MARVAALLLTLALSACTSGAAEPSEQPRRFADYEGTSSPSEHQCELPVAQRTGGWICPQPK